MKVELLVTLKSGTKVWRKGVFNDPIPSDLQKEIKVKTGTVEVLDDTPSVKEKKTEPNKNDPIWTKTTINRLKKEELLVELYKFKDFRGKLTEHTRADLIVLAIERLINDDSGPDNNSSTGNQGPVV